MALDLNATMDALGAALATITGLRVTDYPASTAAVPAAMVGLPTTLEYDSTKGRGLDHVVIPITLLVGNVVDRSARDALSAYLAGSGASSIKAALDGKLGGVVQTARVMGARIEVVTLGGVDYLGATFDVDIYD